MSDPTIDPTLDRLLRHMAWANAELIARLTELPVDSLSLASPRNEWTVVMILDHLVSAAGRYASRLEGGSRPERAESPATAAGLAELAADCAAYDARIRAQAAMPDGPAGFAGQASDLPARSTVVAQAIHHATEHRAQIAGALATNGVDAIDLDALDLWAFADTEGGAL
jgi:uncharacterized damage-inducible protein DinB